MSPFDKVWQFLWIRIAWAKHEDLELFGKTWKHVYHKLWISFEPDKALCRFTFLDGSFAEYDLSPKKIVPMYNHFTKTNHYCVRQSEGRDGIFIYKEFYVPRWFR